MAEYRLIAAKRDWVPDWLWSACKPFVLWLWPLREILTKASDG
jgi:hypothetical protein